MCEWYVPMKKHLSLSFTAKVKKIPNRAAKKFKGNPSDSTNYKRPYST